MYDVIIVGAGVTGLGAAWHLTEKLMKKVLLVEQFPFPHQFGSSAGHSRIIRQLYNTDYNCNLMKEAVQMWRDLETKSGETLFIQNGMLNFGPNHELIEYVESIKLSEISAHQIATTEAKKMFPNFCIPEEYCVLYDPIAGVLRADKCLQILKDQSVRNGLEFHDMEKVQDISILSNSEVEVTTSKRAYKSKSVILATGIWSRNLLNKIDVNLPLIPKKIYYGLFKPKDEDDLAVFNYNNLPSFMSMPGGIYGMAGAEYPGCLKIGDHTEEEINPDKRDADGANSSSKEIFLKNVQSFLQRFIPNCSTIPVNITTCVVTITPDEQPVLDYHNLYKNIVIGCGFSAAGFKSGVIHGKLLAQLATNTKTSYDMKPFCISRFQEKD